MSIRKPKMNRKTVFISFFFLLSFSRFSSSQRACPNCGTKQVPYPLSTKPNCGDPNYPLRCDPVSKQLFFDTLNGSSYLVLNITASIQRMVVKPSPWIPNTCITQDMVKSEGIWLNQSLPYRITSSNTIFLLNCSPRLLVSPLNCTGSSLCHEYLESSGRVDRKRAAQCSTSGLQPCCTFVAGGMPSACKIRVHRSGCQAFRSVLDLDQGKPASQWEEGLEIEWAPPPEPVCRSDADCSGESRCSVAGENGTRRCLCTGGYYWNQSSSSCTTTEKNKKSHFGLVLKVSIGAVLFFVITVVTAAIMARASGKKAHRKKLAKSREVLLRTNSGGKSTKMFTLKELKKATDGFSKDRILGTGGYGEVYKGELWDGTHVAVKSAKLGNVKSTDQILNEVGILSQVNHKNLVKLLGVCVESEQPLMIYEYISNGTLHHHLHGKSSVFLNWKTRLRIAIQTAEALSYLHSSVYTPIYHRDIKSTNILLDDDFNAKVADFGLSRLASPGFSHASTCAQGTLGYLDPEYYRNYQLTDKSDVYSFGVVLLELLTSKNVLDFGREDDDVNLVFYVGQRAKCGSILEVVDQRLVNEGGCFDSLRMFCELGLECLREKRAERPSMKDVVRQLHGISEAVNGGGGSNEVSTEIS